MELAAVENIQFQYNNETVLEGISFNLKPKEFVLLTGPNGAAKSTLLKIMLGLLKPQKGRVHRSRKNAQGRKMVIGYVPQQVAAFNTGFPTTVFELVKSGRYPQGKWFGKLDKQDEIEVKNALKAVEMWEFRDRKIGNLSGGQKQRICIARVLASDPDLLVLDEPTAGMDVESRERFYQLMKHYVDEHDKTIFMVTHDQDDVEKYADRQIVLKRKENVQWRCFSMDSCSEPFGRAD